MLGSTEVYMNQHSVDLANEPVEAVSACERLIELLADLVVYVTSLTTKSKP